jgi:hypothetical protein
MIIYLKCKKYMNSYWIHSIWIHILYEFIHSTGREIKRFSWKWTINHMTCSTTPPLYQFVCLNFLYIRFYKWDNDVTKRIRLNNPKLANIWSHPQDIQLTPLPDTNTQTNSRKQKKLRTHLLCIRVSIYKLKKSQPSKSLGPKEHWFSWIRYLRCARPQKFNPEFIHSTGKEVKRLSWNWAINHFTHSTTPPPYLFVSLIFFIMYMLL